MIRRQHRGEQVRVTFVLPDATSLGKVSVVGDFNGWEPGRHQLVSRTNGTRSIAVSVRPGSAHRFRYLAEGGLWFDDPDADTLTQEGGVLRV